MRATLLGLCGFAVLAGLGCKHDLAALRSGRTQATNLRDAGTTTHLIIDAGDGGSGEGGALPGTSAGACEPCDAVTDAGVALGLRSCCRGAGNSECGLTFGQGGLCLPRMVPGAPSTECPAMRQGPANLDGCCRPDARCGLSGTMFDLGCVARDEIFPALGLPRAEAIPCEYECATDADCGVSGAGFVCTEDPKDAKHMRRICAKSCQRDPACLKGQICGLGNDLAMDRVLEFCQAPIGTVAPGEYCSAAQDCIHGVCLNFQGMDKVCSQLCLNKADCPVAQKNCDALSIQTVSKSKTLNFQVCEP
jgi:hypothetical protein